MHLGSTTIINILVHYLETGRIIQQLCPYMGLSAGVDDRTWWTGWVVFYLNCVIPTVVLHISLPISSFSHFYKTISL